MIRVYAYEFVPAFAQGLVRDLRVRWALEEAGLPYEVVLIPHSDRNTPAHRARQPFGQVPAYEEHDLVLFESGAIVWHIAEKSPELLPRDANLRIRVLSWMFAALNSIEPFITQLVDADIFNRNAPWVAERRPALLKAVEQRLADLTAVLANREYLEGGRFTAADLIVTTVLRIPRHTELVKGNPTLAAYVARCEARPAFKKVLADQLQDFARHAPPQA